ncbi:MAG: CRISPR-associated endonuclease Cas2 [Thiotrichales bacterium]|jgi:CRISPR-associated endonuclease Cas2|nr:CRISPR-associated endonuclease Cas2 [Thiotrichales bacterium]
MHWLVCFDIQHDRTRSRVSRYLEKVGVRVQGSVFEVILRKESQRNRLIKSLQGIIAQCEEPGADIRFYRMNDQTIAMSHTLDGKPVMQYPKAIVL